MAVQHMDRGRDLGEQREVIRMTIPANRAHRAVSIEEYADAFHGVTEVSFRKGSNTKRHLPKRGPGHDPTGVTRAAPRHPGHEC